MSWILEFALWALGCSLLGNLLVGLKLGDDIAQEKQKGRLIEMRNLYRKHLSRKKLEEYLQCFLPISGPMLNQPRQELARQLAKDIALVVAQEVEAEQEKLSEDYGKLRNVWHTFAAASLAVAMVTPAVVYAILTANLLLAAGLLICTMWPWTLFGPGYNHFTGRSLDYRSDRGVDRLISQFVDWFQSKFQKND